MDWTRIIEVVGGTAVVVAATAWIAKSTIGYIFSRELEAFKIKTKAEHDLELEHLRDIQRTALAEMQNEAEERLEHVRATIDRMERLEANLIKRRGEGYGEIWKLTGSLNLFGPIVAVDGERLSRQLKNWYFEHGWVLTQESKKRYFLVQEALSFGMLRSISFRRPKDEQLFGSQQRPVEVLRQLRSELLNVEVRSDYDEYAPSELEVCVDAWKSMVGKTEKPDESAEGNWVLLQFVLSAFRSGIVEELESRERTLKAEAIHAEDA